MLHDQCIRSGKLSFTFSVYIDLGLFNDSRANGHNLAISLKWLLSSFESELIVKRILCHILSHLEYECNLTTNSNAMRNR